MNDGSYCPVRKGDCVKALCHWYDQEWECCVVWLLMREKDESDDRPR